MSRKERFLLENYKQVHEHLRATDKKLETVN